MSPEEIQAMAKGLAEGQAVWYVLSAVIAGFSAGVGAYLAEKAKNRATKEDIGKITLAVKQIESGFNEKLADLQAHHQMRMVAAERRMQAHQDAYEMAGKLSDGLKREEAEWSPLLKEAENWYSRNSLFLSPSARESFNKAKRGCLKWRVRDIQLREKCHTGISSEDFQKFIDDIDQIRKNEIDPVFSAITKEVALPSFGVNCSKVV